MQTTIFLRQPVGVAIHTTDFETPAQTIKAYTEAVLGVSGLLVVSSDKARLVAIHVDNIASVEAR